MIRLRTIILNSDKCVPGSYDAARALGYNVLLIEGADEPAVQFEPIIDRRFEAATAAMQGIMAGEAADTNYQAFKVALRAVGLADALIAELDKEDGHVG